MGLLSCGGDEEISLEIIINEQSYTGPSLCAQDWLIWPLCLTICAALLFRRFHSVLKLPQAHGCREPSFWMKTTWIERLHFSVLVLLVLFPILCIFLLDSDDPTAFRQIIYYVSHSIFWGVNFLLVGCEVARDMVRGPELKSSWMIVASVLMIRVRVASLILVFEGLNATDSHSVADIVYFWLACTVMMLGLIETPLRSKSTASSGGQNQYGMFVDNEDGAALSQKTDSKQLGELTASWLSKITFGWLSPLLTLGYKRQLTDADLCPLIPDDTMSEAGKALLHAWNNELTKRKLDPKRKSPLFNSLFAVYWPIVLLGGVFKLINDSVVFIGPMLLQQLIRFIENGGENRSIADGAFIAIGIFIAKTIESFASNQCFHLGYRVGSQARAAVTSLVYRKAFLLSAKGRQDFKMGELVSLMSVDAQRLAMTSPHLHQFWSAPCQLFITIALLYMTVGPSILAGFAVMILLTPVNMYIRKKQSTSNREIMKLKDQRSNKMDEILQGIRIIKYFAWERSFFSSVSEVRKKELDLIWTNSMWGIASITLFMCSPMLVTLITFLVYTGSGEVLKPNVAFTALALFNVMRMPLTLFPLVINFLIESREALRRLAVYLQAEEIDRFYYANSDSSESQAEAEGVEMVQLSQGPMVKVENGSFSWAKASERSPAKPSEAKSSMLSKLASIFKSAPDDEVPTDTRDAYTNVLRNIDIEVKAGELYMVCGPVGSGKSSLLGAILGETRKDQGRVWLSGKVAYAAQQPWIMNSTVMENILFGAVFNEERYAQVLAVCALKQDMEILPAGDKTEIGERGINLSGGQKARISLARAVYQDADIYILDDPLSAVDVHVSKHIFQECILGYLGGKTRLLVTHQVQYLRGADRVMVIDKGTIAASGTFDSVTKSHPHLIVEGTQENDNKEKSNPETSVNKNKEDSNIPPTKVEKGSSPAASDAKEAKGAPGRTVTAENRQKGTIPLRVWKGYLHSMTLPVVLCIIASYLLSQLFSLLSDGELGFWASKMVQNEQAKNAAIKNHSEMPEPEPVWIYFGIFAVLTVLAVLFTGVRSVAVAVACFKAAAKFHDEMLRTVIRAPVAFFDTTPTGRILNRFSSDQYTVDNDFRQVITMLMMCIVKIGFVLLVILYVTPVLIVAVIPLGYVYLRVQKFYRVSSRELKRLESVSKSPIYAQFSETLNGVTTIRSFSAQSRFANDSDRLNDVFSRAYYCNNSSTRWIGIRLEFIGNVAVGCASLFAVIWNGGDAGAAGMVGLSVTYALEITSTLNWAIRTFTQIESNMVSVERLEEYTKLDTEKADVIESNRPPASWPQHGVLSFENVQMKYREELSPALKDITFTTKPGEKIGVVGRTGAGKSSLAVALFRISELCGGRVVLDGIDVSQIGLADLRSRMSIIPQDPILFAGTVRTNLDPFDEFGEAELWEALGKVQLKDFFRDKGDGLGYAITEGGANLSVGQRQLMCMARSLLRRAKVIIMDEATASVDMQTDGAIQETIREGFRDSTVITIAHRLATVMACDRIMVLGEGRVLEIGAPAELIANPTGVFRSMTRDSESTAEALK